MMHKTMLNVTAMSGLLAAGAVSMQMGQPPQEQEQPQHSKNTEQFAGKIVDLNQYMTMDEAPDPENLAEAGEHTGGPVGLLVTSESWVGGTETELHVLVAPPKDRDAKGHQNTTTRPGSDRPARPGQTDDRTMNKGNATLERAQSMTGQSVRITGQQRERQDITAIAIHEIKRHRDRE